LSYGTQHRSRSKALDQGHPSSWQEEGLSVLQGTHGCVDYKDVNLLRRFMSDRGKIRARRVTGNCAQHQREVATAIKTARELALLPYTHRTVSERGPGRGSPRAAEARAGAADLNGEAPEGADLAGRGDFEAAELQDVGAEV
jgi:ribosomal protein S18